MQRLLNNNNNGELEELAEQKRGIFSMLGASFNSTAEEIERLNDATSKLNITLNEFKSKYLLKCVSHFLFSLNISLRNYQSLMKYYSSPGLEG